MWIPVELTARGQRLQYFSLKSPPMLELLHPNTIMTGKLPVKPVLDLDRVKPHRVFVLTEDSNLVVAEGVREAIVAANCTGIVFLKVLMAARE